MAASSIFDVLVKFSGNSAEAVDAVKKVSKAEREAAAARKTQAAEQKKAWETVKTQTVDLVKIIRNASLAIGGAMIAIAKSAANYGDEMLAMSEKTGISVETLSRLGYAAKIGETSLESLTSGMALLSRKMADAADGNAAAAKTFSDLGISYKNADGSLRPAIDVMLDFSEVAKNSNDSTRLTAQAMELFGKRGAELIPFLKQGKAGINELMKEADRLGITLDEKTARGGDLFNQSLDKLNGALQGIRNTIGKEILPILTKYIEQLTNWIAANKEIIAQKISDFFKGFIETIKSLVKFFYEWKTAILSVAAAFVLLSAAAKIMTIVDAFKKLDGTIGKTSLSVKSLMGSFALLGVALITINTMFDKLNNAMDDYEARAQKNYADSAKSLNNQIDIQRAYMDQRRALYKKDGDSQTEANTKALADWKKKQAEMGLTSTMIASETNRRIKDYANKNKDDLAAIINEKLAKEKEAAGTAVTVAGETAAAVVSAAKKLAEDLINLEIERLNRTVSNEKLSVEARRGAAEKLLQFKQELLTREKQAEIDALSEKEKKNTEILNQIEQLYKLKNDQLISDNAAAQQAITDSVKKAAGEKIAAEQKYQDAISDLDKRLADYNIDSLQDIVNDENESNERRLAAAQQLFDAKMQLIVAELEAEKEKAILLADTPEKEASIRAKYAAAEAVALARVREDWKETEDDINGGAETLNDTINNLLNSVNKGAANVQSGLATIDKLLGTDTGGLQDAVGSAVGAFSSGASAVGSFMSGDVIGGISSALSAVGSVVDFIGALTESTQEGYVKQLGKQGFNDEYSQELLDKMSEVSDAMGDKSYGIKAYIEDFFKETNIDNAEEFSRMSDLLNESIGEYISQGHTADEAYDKFGDELAQLTDAQEKYGFETVESLDNMLAIQRSQTKAGKVAGLTDVVSGIEKMIGGMAGQNYSQGSWTSVFGMLQDAFKQLQGQGLSMQEIQAIIGPTMEKALAIAEKNGVDTSSIEQLKSFYAKMTGASGLLDVISGLDTAVNGLAETGTLSQENVNQSTATALETYQKLLNQGFSQNEALQQIGPTLADIQKAAEQYGFTIPAELSDLVTAAEGIGATGEKPLDETIADGLVTGFDRVVEVMKGFYDSVPRFARGGFVQQTEGEEGIARIHGGEYVLAADAVRNAGINAINTVNNSGVMPTKYVPVMQPSADTQQIAQELKNTSNDLKNQQAAFLAGFGNTIGKSLKEGIAAAMPQAGKTEVSANVALNGNSILKFLQTAMNNGSLVINANAVRVQ